MASATNSPLPASCATFVAVILLPQNYSRAKFKIDPSEGVCVKAESYPICRGHLIPAFGSQGAMRGYGVKHTIIPCTCPWSGKTSLRNFFLSPTRRVTFDQVMKYSWINLGHKEKLKPYVELLPDYKDPQRAELMVLIDYTQEELKDSLMGQKPKVMATHLLLDIRAQNWRAIQLL